MSDALLTAFEVVCVVAFLVGVLLLWGVAWVLLAGGAAGILAVEARA